MSETFTLPNGQILVNVHPAEACEGRWCVVHDPLPTYDRADLYWRNDRGIFEVICDHGVGHPAPEQYLYWSLTDQMWQGIHGCDGCCERWEE